MVSILMRPLTNSSKRPISGDSNIEDGATYCPPTKRFQATSASSDFKWILSDEMKSYALKQFHTYTTDAYLNDSIKNPVPQNFLGPAPLHNHLKNLLEGNQKFVQIQQDKIYQTVQQKIVNVMGPLSKAWQFTEMAITKFTKLQSKFVSTDIFNKRTQI